ncbi:hypothetical protein BXP70_21175 [Hymenobacter crusticola]|uniref:Capsule assembly Wzi family protein n=1 Tax=Hymenobacter crusticola TaxID=1770526 RepID=A0A243WAY5_9BACT|nr:hypothetical protein BXP70_21175 [Hymenobacter crusticola]
MFDKAAPKNPTPAPKTTQGATYVPLDQDVYRLIDRYAIKYGPDTLNDPHTSVRPYSRVSVARLAQRIVHDSTAGASLSAADRFNARYLLRDNWHYTPQDSALGQNQSRRPILKNFYRNQSDLFHVATPDFTLRVNPVLLLQAGKDNELGGLRYVNTRGIQVEGVIDQRLGFYTFLADNQMAVPGYVQRRIDRDRAVPHEGYWKPFKGKTDQYDFFSARGYVTYAATKHINVQLGHDRNIIGNGYRSLILSDYSAPYFFLKLNTRIWKLNYQNLFAEMTASGKYTERGVTPDTVFQKKYFALHHLSLDVTPNFNIGVFESEVFSRRKGNFELQYLNPIIFYRAIEQHIGSEDNAILGLDFKWNIKHRAQLYGQLILDEFVLSEIRSGNGWWANKQAVQLGGKLLDVAGISNLDIQGEFSYIRPYTYQHEDRFRNYQHYQQPLAHPMGANLYELLGIISYQPSVLPRLNLVAKGIYTVQGTDYLGANNTLLNYGGNVLLPYTVRPTDANGNVLEYGFRVGDGNKTRLLHTDFTATYQVRHSVWLDAKLIARHQTSALPTTAKTNEVFATLALRWNIAQRLHEF